MTTGQHDGPPGVDGAALHRRLAAERDALPDVSAASAESRDPVAAMATERRRAAAVQRIEAALARIKAGEYGWCAQCGEPIAPARLTLDPAVPTCIACAGPPKR
jgi:RNA polymerase-binding transcription factor DksA